MKRILYLLFIPLFLFMERVCHKATDGFAIVNITSTHPTLQSPSGPLPEGLLDQPFHYLNCGAQSYVFESSDGNYVIKFFKHHHMRIPPWIQPLPLPKKWAAMREIKKAKKRGVCEEAFESVRLAFDHLKEECGLIYLHLNKSSDLNTSLTIYDKIGVRHELALDNFEFYVQEKARLAITDLQTERAHALLSSLIDFSLQRCKKGVFDKDPDFVTNFGLTGDRLIQIDVGRFSIDPSRKLPEEYCNELVRITRPFRDYLQENHTHLIADFDKLVQDKIDEELR